jgi:hypothetical protein
MVETISPVGHGDRTRRWLAAVALHALGATLTASVFGAGLGAFGSLVHAPWGAGGLALTAAVALAYAARELVGMPLPVPAARRQVPDWWRSFFSWPIAASLYGAGLGVGFLTFLTHGTLMVVACGAALSGRPAVGAVLMGAFGLARGLSALAARSVRTGEAGSALVDRLASHDPDVWRLVNGAALALVAGSALAALPQAVSQGSTGATRAGFAAAAAGVSAVAFGWSALAKISAPERWRRALAGHALQQGLARSVAVGVPVAELAVPASVIAGAPAAGCVLALLLLTLFSAAVVWTRIRGGDVTVACGCFGGTRARNYRLLLARNVALGLVATAGLGASSPAMALPGAPGTSELLPFGLAVSAAVVAVFTSWRATTWLRRAGRG